ncbi:MAG: M1 family metallopeptidase [Nannocystales bacterium]
MRVFLLPCVAALALSACDSGARPRSVGLQIDEPTEPLRPAEQRGSMPDDAQIANYAIDAKLDEESFRIKGLERITFRNRSRVAVDHLAVHLYMNAFSAEDTAWMSEGRGSHRTSGQGSTAPWGRVTISSIRDTRDDQALSLVPGSDPTVATIPLARPLAPGAEVEVDIGFTTDLPEVFARTGYQADEHTQFVLAGQWFPKLGVLQDDGTWNNHVFTFHSEFFADFGDYRVILDVPKGWVVGATGIRTREEDDDSGRVRHTYEAQMVHDFAWTASPNYVEHIATHEGIRIRQLHTPQTWQDAQVHLDAQVQALDSMQRRFGPYPWSSITIVHPPAQAGGAGGMEYPTFFTSGPLLEIPAPLGSMVEMRLDGRFTTVHEFGHQFFQGLLASNESEAPWLDEGLNTFSNTLVLDDSREGNWAVKVLGHPLDSGDLLRLDMARLDNIAVIDQRADQFAESEALYGRTVYRKTAAALRSLRNLVGHQRFDDALRTYTDAFRFGHPSPEDFFNTLTTALEDDPAAPGLLALSPAVTLDVRDWLQQAFRTPRSIAFSVRWVENRTQLGDAGWHRGEDGTWVETPRPETSARTSLDPGADDASSPNVPDARGPEGLVVFERSGPFITPVQYAVTFEDGSIEEAWWDGVRTTDTLTFPGRRIRSVSLDPHRHLELEAKRIDNHRFARRADRPVTTDGDLAELTEAALLSAMLGVSP